MSERFWWDRSRALLVVLLLHAALGYLLVSGLRHSATAQGQPELKVFLVEAPPPPPPPPPKTRPDPKPSKRPEGAASPTSLKANPTPIVAPPPKLEVKSPVVAVPEPTPVPPGAAASAGSSDTPGPGTGAGGAGIGTGSGGQGSGNGGGGSQRAVRLSGALDGTRDYPRASRLAGVEGSVAVEFTVAPDGRVDLCRVLRSTANAEIDAATCRLIQRRFVYEPARDASGRPVPEVVRRTFDWTLPRRR